MPLEWKRKKVDDLLKEVGLRDILASLIEILHEQKEPYILSTKMDLEFVLDKYEMRYVLYPEKED